MPAYFVTATGTDIGKTYVSAALLSAWRRQDLSTVAVKPVMSGFGGDALDQSDAGRFITATGGSATIETVNDVCLHRLEPPLASTRCGSRVSRRTTARLSAFAAAGLSSLQISISSKAQAG